MASRFFVPDSSPGASSDAPSTPERHLQNAFGFDGPSDAPSTTPAGRPLSSTASYTPAGAPTDSFLGSSMMRGVPSAKGQGFGSHRSSGNTGKQLFGKSGGSNAPLGRSVRGGQRQPSALSRQFIVDDDEDEDEDAEGEDYDDEALEFDQDAEAEDELPQESLLRMSKMRGGQRSPGNMDNEIEQMFDREFGPGDDHEEDIQSEASTENADLFLNMRNDDRAYDEPLMGDASDLMMLNTPAATSRVRKEAESIFRRSASTSKHGRRHEFRFAAIAKGMVSRQEPAQVVEPPEFILETEDLVSRMYNEGVGTEEDAERLDNSLANIASLLVNLWDNRIEGLPPMEGEEAIGIGPGPSSEPFEKAAFVAQLMIRSHHGRSSIDGNNETTPPLPQTLFDWLNDKHNHYPDQARQLSRYKPSPACHSMYWQILRMTLLRGDVRWASELLKNAGWEHVHKAGRGDYAYSGQTLDIVRRFAAATCEILDQCPGGKSDWDIWNSAWTLFRVQARAGLTRLELFAEGKSETLNEDDMPQSMSTMARKASSQVPWDVYESLQTLYGIMIGDSQSILELAQDWCEATVGLVGWWDENGHSSHGQRTLMMSRHENAGSSTDYVDRMAAAFHLAVDSDINPNAMNPIEVALASAFEGNVTAAIGFLRIWSLPIACTVAEVASLGKWLPPPDHTPALPADGLDMDDLDLLGVTRPSVDDFEGIKDATLVLYARGLAGIERLSPQKDGWETAIEVLGRMDLPGKSEETVGELLRDLLATLDEHSSTTVDKMWIILNDLGMINFAEETAETFGDILSRESHRYGEALWYFALAHRTDKVRDVLNLLMSYSLIQSTVYPAEKDMDEDLKNLLRNRSGTLEKRAAQDLEAAQLLGRLLAGYATLRRFYEIRDTKNAQDLPSSKALALKRQAAAALVAVISSSGDNIRGGLYDEDRDSVVSEDFLLALLGEATVFVSQSPSVITLEQVDALLKAIEDLQTVGSRVYDACEDFFGLVLSSAQGLKGSTPADLLRKSTTSLSGSSYVLSGSSMLTGHLQKAVVGGGSVQRGWDWRKQWTASTKGDDVLRKLRMALSKDLAALWLEDADGVDGLF